MLKDAGKPYSKDAAQAKLFASETATYSAHQAIQVRGEEEWEEAEMSVTECVKTVPSYIAATSQPHVTRETSSSVYLLSL